MPGTSAVEQPQVAAALVDSMPAQPTFAAPPSRAEGGWVRTLRHPSPPPSFVVYES